MALACFKAVDVFPNSEAPDSECHSLKLIVISLCDRKSFVREFLKFPFFFFFRKERKKLGDKWRRKEGNGHIHRSREREKGRENE